MNREQLAHAIRASCAITQLDSVIIIGSQAILGSYDEDELPQAATASREVDVWPDVEDPRLEQELSDLLAGVAGELSLFEEQHGFALDGVDHTTAALPEGWRERLLPFSNAQTQDVVTGRQYTGWCLSPADLCVAKLCAAREKDQTFVHALFRACCFFGVVSGRVSGRVGGTIVLWLRVSRRW
ncbi:MAG TPA: hypothetical protein DEH05_09640, partial [Propionibacteriaceae bacterium]|nr:hypothetical protein [Propionibacteriaceae bacterium]